MVTTPLERRHAVVPAGPLKPNALYDRIYAVNAAGTIANSMGDVTEGLTWQQIEERYGFVETMLPQEKSERTRKQDRGPDFHYKAHSRPPGMTEDGQERHRLVCEAIIRRGGRITVTDLARTWVELIDPEKFGYLLGPQDQIILMSIKAGIPAAEVGRYAVYPGFIGTGKMIAPVGLVNACDPRQAALDAHDVGRLKDAHGQTGNYALEAAAGIAAGVAHGFQPEATVGSVMEVVLGQLSSVPRKEIEEGLAWVKEHKDWKRLRAQYQERYTGRPMSNAVEVLGSALALFWLADGDPKQALLWAVNFGRDCDCRAYVASSLAAALNGGASLPSEWCEVIERQLLTDPYTVSRRGLKETADGLYAATLTTLEDARRRVAQLDALI